MAELARSFPRFRTMTTKVDCPRAFARDILRRLVAEHEGSPDLVLNLEDGLKIDFPEAWIHLRPSNTEPVLRIIAEAETPERTKELIDTFSTRVRKLAAELE